METVLFFIWNFSSIVFQYCVKTNTKFKYHSGLGDKSCRCEVLAILCVCVRVCACVKPGMFSYVLRTPLPSANFLALDLG